MILFYVALDVKEKMILRSWQVIRDQKFRSFIESEKFCTKIKLWCQPLEEHDLEVIQVSAKYFRVSLITLNL